MSLFKAVNPKNNQVIKAFEKASSQELETKLDKAYSLFHKQFSAKTKTPLETTLTKMSNL